MSKRVAIYCQYLPKDGKTYVKTLLDELQELGVEYAFNEEFADKLEKIGGNGPVRRYSSSEELAALNVFCVITLGGDGTILSAMTLIKDSGLPIMGLNLGRLGFLASIEKKYISTAIREWNEGRYTINERAMLYLESNMDLFGDQSFALNDFTIYKRDTSSMITIHTYINGEFLNSYWADGLIVATPTGSTGYSLSCGGPIIMPGSGNLVITPIAPHNLNVRPIVIPDNSVISFEVEGRSKTFLATLDSRSKSIDKTYQLAVRRNDATMRLIQLDSTSFMNTLRQKLAWGVDIRNKKYDIED